MGMQVSHALLLKDNPQNVVRSKVASKTNDTAEESWGRLSDMVEDQSGTEC